MAKFSFKHFLIFSLLSFFSNAQPNEVYQRINLVDAKKHILFNLDLKSKICFEVQSTGLTQTRPISFSNVEQAEIPLDFTANYFQLPNDQYIITIQGTGQTYLFESQTCHLKRIDKTYYRGFNFGAIQFIRQDTLISLGGKGFWRIHNIPTYYHSKLNEWDLYTSISENGPKGISDQFGGYSSKEDRIYCLGFPPLYAENKDLNYSFYSFDFKQNQWQEIGKVDFNKLALKNFHKLSSQWIAPFFFSSEVALGEFIDPSENKIYQYQGKNRAFFLLSRHLYIQGKYVYSFQRIYNPANYIIKLDSMSIDQLKKESKVIGEFYTPNIWYNEINWNDVFYYSALFIVAVLVITILRFIKNKKQRELDSWGQLPEQGEFFLNYLCAQPNFTCTTEKLNEILQCEGKTIESQRQSRSKFISSINLFFERNHGCHEAIRRHQSEIDKRFVNYVISQEAVTIFTKKI